MISQVVVIQKRGQKMNRLRSLATLCLVLFGSLCVSGCPQNLGSCKCFQSTAPGAKPILDCSLIVQPGEFQNIEGLKPGFAGGPPVFSQIIIRRSQLKEIPQNAFGIAQADEYIIENNPSLETMERNALGRNANPRVISIRNNPLLEVIQYEDFRQYDQLEILRLNDNRILEVPDYAFDGISRRLREIHLQRNIILDLGPFAFRGLPSLKLLDLGENQMSEIPTAALFFSTPPDLVNLANNKIATIDGEAFSDPAFPNRGSYAKHVDFSNNQISVMERAEWETVFNQIDRLEKLNNPTTTVPPPTTPLPIETTTPFPSPAFSTPSPPPTAATTQEPLVIVTEATAPPAPPAPPATQAPQPTAVVPNTENLLLRILERLQLLTAPQAAPAPPSPTTTTAAPTEAPAVTLASILAPAAPAMEPQPVAVVPVVVAQPVPVIPVSPVVAQPAPIVQAVLPPVVAVPEPAPVATDPPATQPPPPPTVGETQPPATQAPTEAPVAPVSEAAPVVIPESVAALTAFGPFLKIREELLAAIRTNPAAAVAAASAVQAAAEAAAKVAETPAEPAPTTLPELVRRKRQSLLNSIPITPAKAYTMNFSGNPIICDCEAKWVFDFRHRYEDQVQNLDCLETRESIFKLHFGHFRRC